MVQARQTVIAQTHRAVIQGIGRLQALLEGYINKAGTHGVPAWRMVVTGGGASGAKVLDRRQHRLETAGYI